MGEGRSAALLVAFEGGEGSGKSTQAARLAARLDAVLTHEPGATPVGAAIRALVLDQAELELDARTEALLMAADRAQHVAEVVAPALAAGRHVVTDRFTGSTLAYQGAGRGLAEEALARLSSFAAADLEPDLVVLLDLAPDQASQRIGGARDRLEAAGDGFHRRVREGYLAQAVRDPGRWVVLDASQDEDALADAVWSAVTSRWGEQL